MHESCYNGVILSLIIQAVLLPLISVDCLIIALLVITVPLSDSPAWSRQLLDAPTCSGVKTEYTAEILAKYQSRCFSPTIGHIRCTCITLLIPATKIAKIFQIITIWNIFEKKFQKLGQKNAINIPQIASTSKDLLFGSKRHAHANKVPSKPIYTQIAQVM